MAIPDPRFKRDDFRKRHIQVVKPTIRRMVIFVTGYDPAGPDRYYLMLRQQTRYYTRRFGVPLELGPYEKSRRPDTYFGRTTIRADWPEGVCEIDYRISDWQDPVLEMAARPFWVRSLVYLFWYLRYWVNGTSASILKWQKKFVIVFSVPFVFLLARLFLLCAGTGLGALIASFLGMPLSGGAVPGFLLAAFCVYRLHRYFDSFYENHLAGSLIFQTALTSRGDPALHRRAREFAREIVAAIDTTKPDEIIIIGHSCGCFHSLPLHKALLDHLAAIPEKPPALLHITMGSLLPFTIANKNEAFFRVLAADLLARSDCRWVDYFAPQDPFSVPLFDVKKDCRLPLADAPQARHEVRSSVFGEIFDAKKLRAFRYNPLRMHFQYLAANDRKGAYDFFRIISHPLSVTSDPKQAGN